MKISKAFVASVHAGAEQDYERRHHPTTVRSVRRGERCFTLRDQSASVMAWRVRVVPVAWW
jgi:hypothetical protein